MNDNDGANGSNGTLFVCCTSHMDWDWIGTFEDYYSNGAADKNPVRYTLDTAFQLLEGGCFQYNLCEVAWLQRYLKDRPGFQTQIAGFGSDFSLLGGGLLSPDNLVCNGELFIRNYLVGNQYLNEIGLLDQRSLVCWIPDDFGQDPELPVVLSAMGMIGTAFWRVPGDEPSVAYQPQGGGNSLYDDLIEQGVAFQWAASDGSSVNTLLLADGYGVPFYVSKTGPTATSAQFDQFVNKPYQWPTSDMFVPSGGDFSTPSSQLTQGISDYNTEFAAQNGIVAKLGTFEDYLNTLPELSARKMNASNFWTGFFASRPQLKINQNRAVRYLMAAETANALLHVYSNYSSAALEAISRQIRATWNDLIPSAHHDFVTGTAPDGTYYSEQLPLSRAALAGAKEALSMGLSLLSDGIAVALSKQGNAEAALVVFNDLGFDRSVGTLCELQNVDSKYNSVQLGSDLLPLQRNDDGTALFQPATLSSMSYATAFLMEKLPENTGSLSANTGASIVNTGSGFVLSNEKLTMTISSNPADKWSISHFATALTQSTNLIKATQDAQGNTVYRANDVHIYDDSGNLYQFGNEPGAGGTFKENAAATLVAVGDGKIVETGPLRVVFEGAIQTVIDNVTYQYVVRYTLIAGEPLVRMSLSGRSPEGSSAVLTYFPLQDAVGGIPTDMTYGTANHWHEMDYVPYWDGPTFRATHDFMLLSNAETTSLAAMYHQGMPAWALDEGILKGTLLRNGSGTQRGAAGTDTDTHTQQYALRLPGIDLASTCAPLMESLSVQEPPFVASINTAQASASSVVVVGSSNQLVTMDPSNATQAIVRVARVQDNSGSATVSDYPTFDIGNPLSLVFRTYQASNNTDQSFVIDLPFASDLSVSATQCVTALEEEDASLGPATRSGAVVTVAAMPTLSTLRVQVQRPYLEPNNGK